MKSFWRPALRVALAACLLVPAWSGNQAFGQDRKDPFGDPLPKRALFRLGTTRLRLPDWPDTIAYSPDGKILAAHGAAATTVHLWDMPSGKLLRELTVESTRDGALVFSPDGKSLAFAGSHMRNDTSHFCLWWVDTGKPVLNETSSKTTSRFASVAFSPDSRFLVNVRSDHLIQTWDLDGGKALEPQRGPGKGVVLALGFLSVEKPAVVCRDGTQLVAWDLRSGKKVYALQGTLDDWHTATFAPDGKTLAVGGTHGVISLHDAATGNKQRQLKGHQQSIFSLAFSADNKLLVSGSWDRTLRIWDVAAGKQLRALETTAGGLTFGVFAPDGKTLASGGANGPQRVCLWNVATGEEEPTFRGHDSGVSALAFAPNGKLLATAAWMQDPIVRLWDPCKGEIVREIQAHPGRVASVAFSPDGKLLATSARWGGATRLWDPTTGAKQAEIPGSGAANAVFFPDGKRLLTGDAHGNACGVRVWDVQRKQWLWERSSGGLTVWALVLSPDGDIVARGSNNGIGSKGSSGLEMWSAANGRPLGWKIPIKQSVRRLAFSPNSRLLVALLGDSTVVWEMAAQQEVENWPRAVAVAFSPGGRFVALALWDRDIAIHDLATGKQCLTLEGGSAAALAFSPDGRLLVAGMYDTTALVWDVTDLATEAPPPAKVDRNLLEQWWSDLLAEDALKAHRASWKFSSAGPEAAVFLRDKLAAKKAADPEINKLIANLGSDRFPVREAASKRLVDLGRAAEEPLREVLLKKPPLEVLRRIEVVLAKLEQAGPPERWRTLRAVGSLEQTLGAEALAALQALAQGPPQAQLTQLAQQAVQRRNKFTK